MTSPKTSDSSLGHQLPIGQGVGPNDLTHGVAEDVGVVPVVEPPLQFFEIAVQVLHADLVEGSHDRPLEQTPDTFNAVGVDISKDPLFIGVADRLMPCIVIRDSQIGFEFIGIDGFRLVSDVLGDEGVESFLAGVGDAFEADLTASLNGAGNPGFTRLAARSDTLSLAADQGFIDFNDSKTESVRSTRCAPLPTGCGGRDTKRSCERPSRSGEVAGPRFPSWIRASDRWQ